MELGTCVNLPRRVLDASGTDATIFRLESKQMNTSINKQGWKGGGREGQGMGLRGTMNRRPIDADR
jgi:hypothetical protein